MDSLWSFFLDLRAFKPARRFCKMTNARVTDWTRNTYYFERGHHRRCNSFYLKITKYLIYGTLRKADVKYHYYTYIYICIYIHTHIFKRIRDTKLWDNERILHESSKHVHSKGGIISHFWWLAKYYKYHFTVNQGSHHEVVKEQINPFKRAVWL